MSHSDFTNNHGQSEPYGQVIFTHEISYALNFLVMRCYFLLLPLSLYHIRLSYFPNCNSSE